jgi:hypothetical protein
MSGDFYKFNIELRPKKAININLRLNSNFERPDKSYYQHPVAKINFVKSRTIMQKVVIKN